MTTESTKRAKAQASAERLQEKYRIARAAYDSAYAAWLKPNFSNTAYHPGLYELKPLEAEMNKWRGQWGKALERLASAE